MFENKKGRGPGTPEPRKDLLSQRVSCAESCTQGARTWCDQRETVRQKTAYPWTSAP